MRREAQGQKPTNLEPVNKNQKEGFLHSPYLSRSGILIVRITLDDELEDVVRRRRRIEGRRKVSRSPPLASWFQLAGESRSNHVNYSIRVGSGLRVRAEYGTNATPLAPMF